MGGTNRSNSAGNSIPGGWRGWGLGGVLDQGVRLINQWQEGAAATQDPGNLCEKEIHHFST
jgi:hypothetical protein